MSLQVLVFRSLVAAFLVMQVQAAPYVSHGKKYSIEIPDSLKEVMTTAAKTGDDVRAKRKVPPVVAEKAMEIGGEMAAEVAKELVGKLAAAGDRSAAYLENGATVDVQPQNGFMSSDMFAPPAWHIEADVDKNEADEATNQVFNSYPMGIGPVMMNGCWGSNYKPGDPCYESRVPTKSTCVNLIDAASFIGTGFDGRGDYSPDSRKMSIIQRNCAGLATYDGFDVPDTMNVHGIYETESSMMTFSDRAEYSSYLQVEAGVSGSVGFCSAGVSTAFGSSTMSNEQKFLSVMDVDVLRYEIFQDVVTANDLTPAFLKEFMDLPTSYLIPGAPFMFQNFILRWGTHYIKSGVFGGRLEINKVAQSSFYSSVEQFSMEAKVDYDIFFASFHAKTSVNSGSSSAQQKSYSSTTIRALGGDQEIAALVSDQGSPTIRTDVVNWLKSIPSYPKAFKFGIGPITDVLYFREEDIFPTTNSQDCSRRSDLQTDPISNKKFYLVDNVIANVSVQTKVYCNFNSKRDFLRDIGLKRSALATAISIYMSEGLVSQEDMTINAGSSYCEIEAVNIKDQVPDWEYIASGKSFTVIFDMENAIKPSRTGSTIAKDELVMLHYSSGMWFVENSDGRSRLSNGFNNGNSGTLRNNKISVKGLVLTYVKSAKMFQLKDEDYTASRVAWPTLDESLKGHFLARVEWPISLRSANAAEKNFMNAAVTSLPCNTHWSNIQTFDILNGGICLYFTAVSEGSIYVVFSAVPKDKRTWYYVEISPVAAAIHKHKHVLTQTSNKNARALGDPTLHQGYFACVQTFNNGASTLIEYGKYMGDESQRIIYLSYNDIHSPIQPKFYAFGSGNKDVSIFQVQAPRRKAPTGPVQCGLGTVYNQTTQQCELNCHINCDANYGCMISESGQPSPFLCNECKQIKRVKGTSFECTLSCDIPTVEVNGQTICPCKWLQDRCVESCPSGTVEDQDTQICTVPECTKALRFSGADNRVVVNATIPVLTEFTSCVWIKSSNIDSGEPHILSYAVSGVDNMILLGNLADFYVYVDMNGATDTNLNFQDMHWHYVCVTWKSRGGEWAIYDNGLPAKKGTRLESGERITAGGSMVLGQDQDSVGGGFNPTQAFLGIMTKFNFWSTALTPIQVASSMRSQSMSGDIYGWDLSMLEMSGQVNQVCVNID